MASTEVLYHPTDRFVYRPIDPIWIFIISVPTLIFFFIVDRLVKKKSSYQKNLSARWLQHNTFVSFVHSSISSILILIAVLRAPEMFEDPLSHINFFNYAVTAFSLGYFCWDFLDCLRNSTSSVVAILFHHVVVIAFLSHILLHTRNLGYGLHALSLEINSVFLHGRRLLRWYPPVSLSPANQRLLKLLVDFGNYLTFFIFRFCVVIQGLYALYVQRHRLHPLVHLFTVIVVSAIGLMNVILFMRLVKSHWNNDDKKKKKKEKEKVDDDEEKTKDEFRSDETILITDHQVFLPS